MNADQFSQKLQAISSRAAHLQEQTIALSGNEPELLESSLEELRNALEELSVAEEELLQQNQELEVAGAEIEAERKRYQDLFEFAPDGYIVTNKAGTIREANLAAARMLNVTQQYLIGKPLTIFISPEERQAFRFRINQLSQLDWTQEWELRMTLRDGEEFDAALTVSSSSRDWEGQPVAWRWLIRDITERKQAELALRRTEVVDAANQALERELEARQQLEAALRQSQERYRAISELTSDYTYAYCIEPNGTFVPELLNDAFIRVCGYTVEDIAANGWQPLIPPEDRQIVLRHGKRLLCGQADVCEHRLITKSGEVRWVRNYARPVFDGTRRALCIYGAAQDITERKQAEWERSQLLEREQEARAKAETASRLKDEFLAIVSHELRSPLNAILGWAQLLCQQQFDAATTERGIKIIERNALLQTTLIEDLLDISRIIRGKLNLQIFQIDLIPVIEAAIHSMQPAVAAKNIHLESVFSSDIGLVSGDLERLQQVIWNLLSNAIKFTPAEGRVEIRLERQNSHAQITVTDTGIGIKPDFLPFIFETFRQSDQSSTRVHRGLGLGLAIVRHLVELHGGVVCAESRGEGQGATFTVQLPLSAEAQEWVGKPAIARRDEPSLNNLQVLVVDDEADSRVIIATMLESNGAQVTATASVREALQALEMLQPDVLVSDIGMPDEDGYTLIRQVRNWEAKRGGFLAAAALTGFAREEDCQQALLAGFQAHVTKPVQPSKLIATVANLARQTEKLRRRN